MPITIDAALRTAAECLANSSTPLIDARALMKFATGLDDAGLIARANEALTPDEREQFDAAVARRAGSEPVAYITGTKEFWSLQFRVAPDALIPRGDSECLIEAALSRCANRPGLTVLDLGAGSGCLLCALLSELPGAFGVGVDRSPAAAALARENAGRLGLGARAAFYAGDWAGAVAAAFDIVIANPPYISTGERAGLAADIRDFEPAAALYAGPDGLDAYRAILPGAGRFVAQGGLLALECAPGQTAAVALMVAESLPVHEIAIIRDLKGERRGVLAAPAGS